jgi:hypothetical protein
MVHDKTRLTGVSNFFLKSFNLEGFRKSQYFSIESATKHATKT